MTPSSDKATETVATSSPKAKNASCKEKNGKGKEKAAASGKEKSGLATTKDKGVNADKAMIGVTVGKEADFPEWYTQTIIKSELLEYYDVSGCYILRPWAFQMWEVVQTFIDTEFKKQGIQNAYFPTFVTKARLETEQSHIDGFSAEVAWVTRTGNSDLAEPIAIRPTSETIMYPAYQKWIRSHRDLPLKLNQWNAVVRWEFKQPTPFIRTREFLWQEGHTAHVNETEAQTFAKRMLEVYREAYEDLLAVPVIPGQKSEIEKFAGGHTTYTVEGLITTNGRGLQCATSHYLGTNFAKMFGIEFEDTAREKQWAHQTSFGFTTRSLGAMIMVHGDDKGLVLPPRVAPLQVVIVPIVKKDCDSSALNLACEELASKLKEAEVRVFSDDRDIYNPGWKYNHWELKGVPIRVEVGPRDLQQGTCRVVLRYSSHKEDINRRDIVQHVKQALVTIQKEMLQRARDVMNSRVVTIYKFDDVMKTINDRKVILTPWCKEDACEQDVKKETQRLSVELEEESGMGGAMKTLCIPFEQPVMEEGTKCFRCGEDAKVFALWGRSY